MYKPIFKGPIEGWTVNYCTSNFWRVSSMMEFEDLLQDAYIVFLRCEARYPELDTPQHFMSLYKRAWANHVTDLANEATQLRAVRSIHQGVGEDDEPLQIAEGVGELENAGYLVTLVGQAPEEVRRVLALMLQAPQEIIDVVMSDWRGPNGRRTDGGGTRINKALGLPADFNPYEAVRRYLTH